MSEQSGLGAFLDKTFAVTESGGTLASEFRGGATTFVTMAYIVVVNAGILSSAGIPFQSAVFATCAAAAVGTVLMAWWARYPIALAPGMGVNAYFAFSVVPVVAATLGSGAPDERAWRIGLGLVGWSGLLFVLATALQLRRHITRAIPVSLKLAVSAGIGLFIAMLGLRSAGIIVADSATLVGLGDLSAPGTWIAGVGLLVTGGLLVRNVRGALLLGMLTTTVLALLAGQTSLPSAWVALPAASQTFLKWDLWGALDWRFIDLVVVLLFVDFFDTMGTLVGVGVQGGFMDEHGQLPRDNRAMAADAAATVIGAGLGTSTVTAYVESAAGIADGARTALANMVVAAGFIGAMFFAPGLEAVPAFATAPALIVVGALMARGLGNIDWEERSESLAAFVTAIAIPLTFSISNGIALGILTYLGTKLIGGQGRDVSWMMWGLGVIFLLRYLMIPN